MADGDVGGVQQTAIGSEPCIGGKGEGRGERGKHEVVWAITNDRRHPPVDHRALLGPH